MYTVMSTEYSTL